MSSKRKKQHPPKYPIVLSERVENSLVPVEETDNQPKDIATTNRGGNLLQLIFSNPVISIGDKQLEVSGLDVGEERERHNVPIRRTMAEWTKEDYIRLVGGVLGLVFTTALYTIFQSWVAGGMMLISYITFSGWVYMVQYNGVETVKTKSRGKYRKVKK